MSGKQTRSIVSGTSWSGDGRKSSGATPEVFSAEYAEPHDLNRIVAATLFEVNPLCQALNLPVYIQYDWRLPPVPMLIEPIRDTISAMLDICIDPDLAASCSIRVQTSAWRDRALCVVERQSNSISPANWRDVGALGRLELMVGVQTSRALGGCLRVMRREEDLRLWLELPLVNRPNGSLSTRYPATPTQDKKVGYFLELPTSRPAIQGGIQ